MRECEKCIHHISGSCGKWECEYETLEDFEKKSIEVGVNRLMFALRNPITLDALAAAKDKTMVSAIIKKQADEIGEC